jgi:hypothetical protein
MRTSPNEISWRGGEPILTSPYKFAGHTRRQVGMVVLFSSGKVFLTIAHRVRRSPSRGLGSCCIAWRPRRRNIALVFPDPIGPWVISTLLFDIRYRVSTAPSGSYSSRPCASFLMIAGPRRARSAAMSPISTVLLELTAGAG